MSLHRDDRPLEVLAGPCGDFLIPAEPAATRDNCRSLSEGVWSGEYDHPELPAGIRTVVDVGSGWGAFTVWCAARFGRGVEVHAYDPHREGCALCLRNAAGSGVNLWLSRAAVTSDPGAKFWPGETWGSQRTIDVPAQFAEDVPLVRPADLPPCEFLKVDGEGVEPDVLENYAHWGGLLALAYEWHSPGDHEVCREIVARRGGMRLLKEVPATWGEGNGVALWVRG